MSRASAVSSTQVPEAFDEVADRYDLMVALNPGYHAHLRASADVLAAAVAARHVAGSGSQRPAKILDLGCGSGASTRALVDALDAFATDYEVMGVDASAGMLREATAKAWPAGVRFVHARAEQIADRPEVLGAAGLDGAFAAYLVRNLADKDALLTDLYAALAPGGTLVLHEYSVAGNRRAAAVWTAVCLLVVVPLGWLTSRRTRLYRYLWRSVLEFDAIDALMARLQRAGFEDVRARSFRGWQRGVIHTVHARRPVNARAAHPPT